MSSFGHSPVKRGRAHLRSWGALAQVLLFADLLVEGLRAWSTERRLDAVDDFRAGRATLGAIQSSDHQVHDWAVASVVASVLTAAAFVTWFAVTYRAAERVNPQLLRYGHGWAVGAWFTPILGFWRPPQLVNDALSALERPADDSGWAPPGHRLVAAWWGTFLGANLIDRFTPTSTTLDELRVYSRIDEANTVVTIVAGVLAIVLVGRLTGAAERRRQESRRIVSSGAGSAS